MAALFSPLLDDLIKNLQTLQGVGRRTAQRMAFRLLEHDREKGARLAEILGRSMREIRSAGSAGTSPSRRSALYARR